MVGELVSGVIKLGMRTETGGMETSVQEIESDRQKFSSYSAEMDGAKNLRLGLWPVIANEIAKKYIDEKDPMYFTETFQSKSREGDDAIHIRKNKMKLPVILGIIWIGLTIVITVMAVIFIMRSG